MDEKLESIRSGKYIVYSHLAMYIAMSAYYISAYVRGSESSPVRSIVITAGFALMGIIELLFLRGKKSFLVKTRAGLVYYFLRLLFALVMYFVALTGAYERIFLIVALLFAVETLLYLPFDDLVKRIGCYIIFTLGYSITSIAMAFVVMYKGKMSLPVLIQEIMIIVVVVVAIIVLGELFAAIYRYFEEKLFAQNRVVAELNHANDDLKDSQQKIKKVNETLGMQKIELRAANKKINRSHDEMSVQNEISSTIAASVGQDDMLQKVTKIMRIRLDMDLVMIILEPDNSLLVPGEEPQGRFVALSTSLGEEFERQIMNSVFETDLKELLLLSKTYIQNFATDTIKFFKYLTEENELPSEICLPIVKQEERLGTLVVGKRKENAFMDSRNFYENIASQMSIGISNARLYAKMNDMAIRDGLTRIYNRRHLTEILNGYLSEAVSRKVSVSLALFDIDKFKMVNDTYGHQCGDEVIRYVTALLNKGALANGGIAGRYGGEEFVIAFLNKGLEETYEVVKDIHNQIRSEAVVFGGKEIPVRASAGLASYPETCSNPSELLTRADWAMYHSKRNGRDQITIDSDKVKNQM